jgi:hypothetical protein
LREVYGTVGKVRRIQNNTFIHFISFHNKVLQLSTIYITLSFRVGNESETITLVKSVVFIVTWLPLPMSFIFSYINTCLTITHHTPNNLHSKSKISISLSQSLSYSPSHTFFLFIISFLTSLLVIPYHIKKK